jgi:aldehyde:ferredoxin oxidoreductase
MAGDVRMRARKCGFCMTACQDRLMMGVPGEVTPQTYNAVWQCWGYMTSVRAHVEARAITADYGINGWEVSYGLIPWLQMCRQHGLIDRVNGVEIPVPDKEVFNLDDAAPVPGAFLVPLLHSIARRDGELGDILAEGTCRAAEVLFGGKGLELLDRIYPRRCGETNHWNSHWGTGGSGYWPFWLVPVLQWCVDTRDPASDSTHQYTEHVLRYIPIHGPHRGPLTFEEARHVCQVVYGNAEVCNPELSYDPPETKAIPAIFHHNRGMLVESLVLCDREHTRVFSMLTEDKVADTALMSKLFSATTGVETCEQEMDRAGERVFNLLRAIDMRYFGRDRAIDWSVAKTLTQPAFTDGVVLDLERFAGMLDTYYRLRGWNPANGYPTRARLEDLELKDVADTLQAEGKLG